MRILLPYKDNPKTGKQKFFNRLRVALCDKGVGVVSRPEDPHDLYLDSVGFRWKSDAVKVLRMDGAWINKEQDYKARNKVLRRECKKADAIVYQSNYGKQVNETFVGKFDIPTKVILNGAPVYQGNRIRHQTYFMAVARWRPHKMLKDIVRSFQLANIPDCGLEVFGEVPKQYKAKDVYYQGRRSEEVINRYFHGCSALIHLCWLDCCPNGVVESLANGCPVIGGNTGGIHDLVGPNCGTNVRIYPEWGGRPVNLYHPPRIDRNKVAQAMWDALEWPRVKPEDAWHVDIRNIADQYISFFREVLGG